MIAGSSLKFCLVAEGIADIYPRFGPTMEWDTAAGDAVFRYSGRKAERHSALKYNKESLLNGEFMVGRDLLSWKVYRISFFDILLYSYVSPDFVCFLIHLLL